MPSVESLRRSPRSRPGPATGPSQREVADTSELVLRLIHEAYASRALGATPDGHEQVSPRLSPPAIRATIHLHQHGRRTIGELARGLDVSYGWASRIARELEEADLVSRETDGDDRRVVRISLTDAAVEHLERTYRWHGEAVRRALDPLTPAEREAVRSFLRTASQQLQRPARHDDR